MDNSSQLIPFRKTTGQIHRSLKIYGPRVLPLLQSGLSLEEMITGVKLTLLTVLKLDQEILILDLTLQLTENHFSLQTMLSTTLREYFIINQIILKTWNGGMMMVMVNILKVGEITNQFKILFHNLVLIQFIGTGISSIMGIMVTGMAAQTTLSLIILLTLQLKIIL